MQKPIVESLEKQIALLVGAVYSLGVVIVNFHLAEYGVTGQLSLLRPIYLFAGLYGILPIAMSFLFFWAAAFVVRRGYWWVGASAVLLLIAVTWIGLRLGWQMFDAHVAKEYPLKWDNLMWTQSGLAALLGGLGYCLLVGPWKVNEDSRLTARCLAALPILLLFLFYSHAFSVRVYNRIAPSWGGTKSRAAEFIIDPGNKGLLSELEELGVKFYSDTTRTKNTKLIIQTESDFICVVKKVKDKRTTVSSILLRRDDIQGVRYSLYSY